MSFLQLRNISFSYRSKPILKDFSLTLDESDHLVIIGSSGAGKSTLLKILAGLISPESGEIRMDDRVLFAGNGVSIKPHERNIGMVFQDYALFPHMTIEENVSYADPKNIDSKYWLEKVRLVEKLKKYPRELSGGEQQRVALVRTLAAKPKLVLMDEPFSSLDPDLRRGLELKTYELLNEFNISSIQVTRQLNKDFPIQRKLIDLSDHDIEVTF